MTGLESFEIDAHLELGSDDGAKRVGERARHGRRGLVQFQVRAVNKIGTRDSHL